MLIFVTCFITGCCWEEGGSLFPFIASHLVFILLLLIKNYPWVASRLNRPSSPSVSSQERWSSLFIIFADFFAGLTPVCPHLSHAEEAGTGLSTPKCGLNSAEWSWRITCFNDLLTTGICHKGALLPHCQLGPRPSFSPFSSTPFPKYLHQTSSVCLWGCYRRLLLKLRLLPCALISSF